MHILTVFTDRRDDGGAHRKHGNLGEETWPGSTEADSGTCLSYINLNLNLNFYLVY